MLSFGTLFTGLLCGGAVALYLYYGTTLHSTQSGTNAVIAGSVISIFIGFAQFSILSEVIFSGLASTFVCLAEDPAALQRTKPELYNKIVQVYPQVLNPI